MPDSEFAAPYCVEDLSGLKKAQLSTLIRKQIDCWPKPPFNPSKTTIADMKQALLDHTNGFTILKLRPIEDSPLTSAPSTPMPLGGGDAGLEGHCTPADNMEEISGEKSNDCPFISLLLEDRRFHPVRKSAIRIVVALEPQDGELYVSAKEVVHQLQESHSALTGPVKLGSPFPPNPSYIEYFMQSMDGNNLEDSHFSPESLLVISGSLSLEIVVEDVNEVNKDLGLPSGSIGIQASHHAASPSPQDVKQSKSEAVIAWLKEKATLQEDYPLFLGSHHHVLQNADVVSIWKFASNFHKIYYHSKNPITRTLIKKSTIYAALGVHETWFNEALSGDRLVAIYGPGGPYESPVVVSELAAIRNPSRGRSSLLRFLQNWEVDHPCVSS